MTIKDFHGFVRMLLILWLSIYVVMMLPALGKSAVFYVLADFTMPMKHYLDIIFTIYRGALWLVPTAFLALAYYLSRPNKFLRG